MVRRKHRVEQHRSAIPGIEAMTFLSGHAFPRHSHDQFGMGIMTVGAQRSWSLVGQVEAEAGDVIMLNPGEMHDGLPTRGEVRGWRILYLDPRLVAREISHEETHGEPVIRPVARDPELARLIGRLFSEVGRGTPDSLAAEESLLCCLLLVLQKHRIDARDFPRWAPSVQKAVHRLDAAPELTPSLAELAALSGVSRFQLLRGFARSVGTTPHAYLIQRRVRLVRRFLAAGLALADAALRAGFADQSHMTRAFVRHFGITPGRYKEAIT